MGEKKKRVAVYDHDAQMRYQAKLKTITIRLRPEDAERYVTVARERGYSLRGFILAAVEEKIKRG